MKPYRLLLLLFAVSALFFAGCEDPDEDNGDNPQPGPTLGPIEYDCEWVTGDVTWSNDPDRPVDYRVDCEVRVESGGNLTIEPGTVIEFTENGSFYFTAGSEFHFNGTASDSIFLIGTQAQPGHWGGFEIWSDNVTNNMDFVNIRDAGNPVYSTDNFVIRLRQGQNATVAFNDVTFEDNLGTVLMMESSCKIAGSNNLTFNNNTGVPIKTTAGQLGNLKNSFVFNNNGADYIEAFNNSSPTFTAVEDLTIDFNVLPIHMSSLLVRDGAKLEIDPGVTMLFPPDGLLDISIGATWIEVNGTAEAPVIFDAITPLQGWKGIALQGEAATQFISHAIVNNGGNAEVYILQQDENASNIYLRSGVVLNLSNSEINNSKTYGITLTDNSSTVNETNVTYINNAKGKVHTINP